MFTDGSIKFQLQCYVIIERVFQEVEQEFRELSEERKLTILLKNRHLDTKLFGAVSIGTKFAAYVACSDFIVSTVLPACVQEAN